MPLVYRPRSPLAEHVTLTRHRDGGIVVTAPAWLWRVTGRPVSSWYRDGDRHTRTLAEPAAESLLHSMATAMMVKQIIEAALWNNCPFIDLRRRGWPTVLVDQFGPAARAQAARRRPDLAVPSIA